MTAPARAAVILRLSARPRAVSTIERDFPSRPANPDSTAGFVGFERITGTIGGRRGSLVLQHVGTFEDGAATATITIVSGTDELEGATGSGTFLADPSGRITLDINL